MGLITRIQQKIELWKLEQRYTRGRNRRSTFVSNAVYVDGEYVYQTQTPNATGSSGRSGESNSTSATTSSSPASDNNNNNNDDNNAIPSPGSPPPANASTPSKRNKRWSAMPGFGSMTASQEARAQAQREEQEWRRPRRVSFGEVR